MIDVEKSQWAEWNCNISYSRIRKEEYEKSDSITVKRIESQDLKNSHQNKRNKIARFKNFPFTSMKWQDFKNSQWTV